VPEGTFEFPEQEPIDDQEQEPEFEDVPEWVPPEDLAGDNDPEIPVPEGIFEPAESEQEPEFEDIPEWVPSEKLAGDYIPEIQVPEETFEPVKPESEPIDDQELDLDSEYVPDWVPPEELAGDNIPEILVPEDTFEFLQPELESIYDEVQEDLNSTEEKCEQENHNDIVQKYPHEHSSDVLQKQNDILIMGNSFYSSHNDTDSFRDFKPKEEGKDQQKPERKLPIKTRKTQTNKKKSGSDRNTINKQKSGQRTILVLKPEIKEKKTENKNKAKPIKNEKDEKETQKENEEEVPQELRERYKRETGKRAIYAGKNTKGFDEWQKIQKKSETVKENKEKRELKEDWELLLEKWINEANEKVISKEIKKKLLEKIRKYRRLKDLSRRLFYLLRKENLTEKETDEIETLIQQIKNMEPIREEIFNNLRAFKKFYEENIKWFEYRIQAEREKFTKFLAEKLEKLKESNELRDNSSNWKDLLKRALGSSKEIDSYEKILVVNILKKSDLTDKDIKNLSLILSKLETKVLVDIFGETFYLQTQNYVRWGWDFYRNIKMEILRDYFSLIKEKSKLLEINKSEKIIKNKLDLLRSIVEIISNNEDLSNLNDKDIKFLFLLSELIGIILGDGNIRRYSFRIDLNKEDEIDYVNYVSNLIYQVLGKFPQKRDRRGIDEEHEGKGIRLIINGKGIIDLLTRIGLKRGDKIKNAAKAPEWILENKILIPYILKGLFDTDGNIDIHKKWRALILRFVSGSQILIKNFKLMCEILDIKTSNIRPIKIKSKKYNKVYDAWVVSIGSKEAIKKFIEIVEPKKFLYRKKLIAMLLFILKNSERKEIIDEEKKKAFPKKKKINQFTKEYMDFLQKMFKKYNWNINNDLIENLIKEALTLRTHNYNILIGEKLKELFEMLGTVKLVVDFFMNKGEKLSFQTVKNHIKKLLSREKYINIFSSSKYNPLEILGDSFYDKWEINNSRIIIDKDKRKINQFNSILRIKIALEIFNFLKKNIDPYSVKNNLIINHLKELIEKSPYFGRLNYLLNDIDYAPIVKNYFIRLIIVVKEIIKSPNETAFSIGKKSNLKADTVQDIMNKLKKKVD
ncbi:MAG: LAGLIDADG family homing endonuclease, partial [Promethearchaeota archaeon]